MDDGYSWRESRESAPIRLPGPENIRWWAAVAFFIAIILHVAAFFALGHIKIGVGFTEGAEIETGPVQVEQVEVLPPDRALDPPEEITPPPPDTHTLLEEIDVLAKLPENTEMDLKPDINDPEFAVRLTNPALEGDSAGVVVDPAAGFDIDTALPELGRTPEPMPLAADSQIIVDPGAAAATTDTDLDRFAEDLLKKGAGGTAEAGTLDGVVTLDDMVGLPANVLVGKMTMLPSDLLFEYNSAELRESARVGMMKLAMIIEKNPGLYCWIEGHSDLYGTDQYNLELAKRRAAAVKNYLTGSLFLPGDKIETRGFGKTRPILKQGSVEEQAPNRRVEIRMRQKAAPPQITIAPKAEPQPPQPQPQAHPQPQPRPQHGPQAPVLVKPQRALPVEEPQPAVPRAKPVEDPVPHVAPLPQPPKARPVEEAPPKAAPVEEEAPRAAEVIEEPRRPQRAIPVE